MSETAALICLIVNIFFPSFGTFLSACLDKKGFNCSAFGLAIIQALLASVIIGWIWAVVHSFKNYQYIRQKNLLSHD